MGDLHGHAPDRSPTVLVGLDRIFTCIVETPRGSRAKFRYASLVGVLEVNDVEDGKNVRQLSKRTRKSSSARTRSSTRRQRVSGPASSPAGERHGT
jgi:hypothetical protein